MLERQLTTDCSEKREIGKSSNPLSVGQTKKYILKSGQDRCGGNLQLTNLDSSFFSSLFPSLSLSLFPPPLSIFLCADHDNLVIKELCCYVYNWPARQSICSLPGQTPHAKMKALLFFCYLSPILILSIVLK